MRKYWQILRKYRLSLIISPFLVLIGVLSETVQPYLMSLIIDNGVMENDISVITRLGIIMVSVSLAGLFFSVINIRVSTSTSIGFGTDLRTSLFSKIETLSFTEIDKFSTSSLITRLTNDITKIQQVILAALRMMLRAPFMLIMALFFVLTINARLALILLAAIPVLAISVYFILKKGFPFFVMVQQKIDKLNDVVRENLINIRVVKSFVREDFETEKFTRSSEELRDMVIRSATIIVTLFPVMQLILNTSIIAILWFGGLKVTDGNMKVGELISFVNYVMQVLMSLMMLTGVIMQFARASASSERILEVLDTEPSLQNTPEGIENIHMIKNGAVTFHDVCFRYHGGEADVLRKISFKVEGGKTIAVVGATGSAKTSMVQLIPRLYDVTEGEILVDGINVKRYNLDYLHSRIGMVLQKNELFTGTIIENLRWGKPDATEDEVIEAAKAAEAHDFIESFTEGYYTVLGRGGVNVSGGQKQRLCIARALLRKPQILILDDSTSAVDTETELKIRNNLSRILGSTTVFIITQRINTMQSADMVIVLEDGEIEAFGPPAELMEKSEVYREIYNSQQILS